MITPMLRPDLFAASRRTPAMLTRRVLPHSSGRPPPRAYEGASCGGRQFPPGRLHRPGGRAVAGLSRRIGLPSRLPRMARPDCRSIPGTGALRPEEWARWLRWDPVRMGVRPRRGTPVPAGDLDRRRHRRRVVPRPGRRGVPSYPHRGRGPRSERAFRTLRRWASRGRVSPASRDRLARSSPRVFVQVLRVCPLGAAGWHRVLRLNERSQGCPRPSPSKDRARSRSTRELACPQATGRQDVSGSMVQRTLR